MDWFAVCSRLLLIFKWLIFLTEFSCFHLNVQNYTVEIWEGYYKSLDSCMYCDGSFGPIMIRKKYLRSLGSKYKSKEELISFFMNEAKDIRILHCPDCMFYVNQPKKITKKSFQHVAQRFKMSRNGQQLIPIYFVKSIFGQFKGYAVNLFNT